MNTNNFNNPTKQSSKADLVDAMKTILENNKWKIEEGALLINARRKFRYKNIKGSKDAVFYFYEMEDGYFYIESTYFRSAYDNVVALCNKSLPINSAVDDVCKILTKHIEEVVSAIQETPAMK